MFVVADGPGELAVLLILVGSHVLLPSYIRKPECGDSRLSDVKSVSACDVV